MKHLRLLPLALLCLMLTGCGWLKGSYVSVKAHQEAHVADTPQTLVANEYTDLVNALSQMIASAETSSVISVASYPADAVQIGMKTAIRHVTQCDPIGAYAVEKIDYELGTQGGAPAVAITISYRHTAAQILGIQRLEDMDAARSAVTAAVKNYESEVVLLVQDYVSDDFPQLVRSYAQENPNAVMEIPQVTVAIHGNTQERVIELSFAYQTNRDALRQMQSQVKPVFDAAALYVSGDGTEHRKFTQLYSFLMERFPYVVETSITPAYSLLCHGVGDSRAFALVYAYMCREAGLECLSVTGTYSGEPRTWNILSDGDRYYHLDLLRCYEEGEFREMTDDEMTGYVWDYSAYPACPAPTSTPAPEESSTPVPAESQPVQPSTEPLSDSTEPTE